MAERWRPSERELEEALRELGSRLEYPPAPDPTERVLRRIEEEPPPRARMLRSPLLPRWRAAAVLALVVLAASVLGFSPTVRAAVADWLGLEGIAIFRAESPPQTERPLGAGLALGEKVTLREAEAKTGKPIPLPGIGDPDAVYVGWPESGAVTLVYRVREGLPPIGESRIGLILNQIPTDGEVYFAKVLPRDSRLEEATVNGNRGYWISGKPHVLSPIGGTKRLAGNTLLWEQGGRTLRLESALPKEEALKIARSVR